MNKKNMYTSAISTLSITMNNVNFKIFNANAAMLNMLKESASASGKAAKVQGRKIENQTAVNISDSFFADRIKKICLTSRNKSSFTSRLSSKNAQKKSLVKNRISLKRVRSETKKHKHEADTTPTKKHSEALKGSKTINTSRISKRKVKLGFDKTESSFGYSNSVRNSEHKKIVIPYSMNRFQGKYNEVVPAKYAQMIIVLKREKHNKELKKTEERERARKVKVASERIRAANRSFHRSSATPVTVRRHGTTSTSRSRAKRKSFDERLKEIGMEFIIRLRQSESRTLVCKRSQIQHCTQRVFYCSKSSSFEEERKVFERVDQACE
eukprot:TRINITY_DN12867_c0_g2_i4.p1 TRINITY_DN12867_c0_g2~~TRINITY_DN12867_c0_g2_i4.p1  ORF type:complete len:325 (-),score=61.07 TRINITY_DN12867_c0_g2_i4:588-1562(-)